MNLKYLRREKGMTQDQLSRASGVSRITIARIEATGRISTTRVIMMLAKALGCDVNDLLGEAEEIPHLRKARDPKSPQNGPIITKP